MSFLPGRDPRALDPPKLSSIKALGLFLGSGSMAVEVAAYEATRKPSAPDLRSLHDDRKGKRASPVLAVVLWGNGRASIAGTAGTEALLAQDADRSQVERLCDSALEAPDRHPALRLISSALTQLTSAIPGLRNSGLFALHELEAGVPARPDWGASTTKAATIMGARGRDLVSKLGCRIEALQGPASILVTSTSKVGVAVFLERADEIEPASPLFDGLSPVAYALAKADQENLEYVVVAAESSLRIYPVKPGIGTGRRGRTETFVELNLTLLSPAQAGYLWLLCSAEALGRAGTFSEVLSKSVDYAADLGLRLRERAYEDVVPGLATAIARARQLKKPDADALHDTYQMALLVLFRLLFVAYAEDKELLPLHTNAACRSHSLKEIAKRMAACHSSDGLCPNGTNVIAVATQMTKDAYSGLVDKKTDEMTLVAGDSDYVPTVSTLVVDGYTVVVAFWGQASPELRKAAKTFHNLDPYINPIGRRRGA